jgi:PAS domain S-box-containing protein
LAASEAKFQAVIAASPIPMGLNDRHGNITYLNPAHTALFGYTMEDIPTLDAWWPLAYPDPEYREAVASNWLAEMTRARETNTPFQPLEVTIRCKDGSRRSVFVSTGALGAGFENEHVVVFHDITALKRAESRAWRLLHANVHGVVSWAVDGQIIEANETFLRCSATTKRIWSRVG